MRCPVDEEVLQLSERQGVEIDYCPRCRGVWLDRGELDKIIDRVDGDDGDDHDDRRRSGDRDRGDRDRGDRDRGDRDRGDWDRGDWDRDDRPHRKKKKSSLLSEIFEMGG
ncbi:MAG: zf-TFIIB domain-containing protein [Actinobacteria bacterium]|nr:zf-TFIIB domain-containing protein [Actinomycetota bacterium]